MSCDWRQWHLSVSLVQLSASLIVKMLIGIPSAIVTDHGRVSRHVKPCRSIKDSLNGTFAAVDA